MDGERDGGPAVKFSVVVPSFNQVRFLRRALESLLIQRPDVDLECIVMDGGSEDGSVDEIRRFALAAAERGIGVHWQSGRDGGQAAALRSGMSRATGDVHAYLNSDDCYLPGALRRVRDAFESDPSAMWVTGDCRIVDSEGREIQRSVRAYKRYWARRYTRTRLHLLNFIAQPATFWRRDAADRVGEFDARLHYTMDYDYWLRLAGLGAPAYVDEAVAEFRIHGESKGGSSYREQFREDFATLMRYESRPVVRAVHRAHNAAIVAAYRWLK